jgi:hypothetical protein
MGMPRRVSVKGMQGVIATVVVTVVRDTVWLWVSPPFTWEAIMEPAKVDELIHVLELAREDARKAAAGRCVALGDRVDRRAITKDHAPPEARNTRGPTS